MVFFFTTGCEKAEPGLESEIDETSGSTLRGNGQGANHRAGKESRCMMIRWLFRCVAAVLAVVEIVAARNTFGPDPRAYMELARAILRHDWAMVINAYWSALYPWLLAAVLGIVKPSLRREFPVAHAFSFFMYLACMAAFEFFWVSLLQRRQASMADLSSANPDLRSRLIPSAQMWILGYSLFVWTTVGSLVLLVNPDLLVTASVLVAAGLLMRMEMAGGSPRALYVWLGICLGLGYLAKAILFPMAWVFLGTMVFVSVSRRTWRRRRQSIALALLIFVALASPEIALLSHAKGRFTFSDTGKLNLAWFNYDLPYRNWQGLPAGTGTPAHPTRKLFDHPAVYEFNGPLRTSYPPWFDPSYWNEGLSPKFSLATVVKHVLHEITVLGSLAIHPTAWIVGIFLILLGCRPRETLTGISVYFYLIVLAVVALALYCLTNIQDRFFIPWEFLIWGSVLAGVRLRPTAKFWSRGIVAPVSLAMLTATMHLVYGESVQVFHSDATPEYVTAEGLQKMGLQPGAKVGAIGFDNDAQWAYLARFDIVAEINTDETCLFWSAPPAIQKQILEKFAQAGASVVVANTGGGVGTTSGRGVPIDLAGCSRPGDGWRKIEGSPNHAFFMK
jgi:hypothetical protein